MIGDELVLAVLFAATSYAAMTKVFAFLSPMEIVAYGLAFVSILSLVLIALWMHFSKYEREKRKRKATVLEIPLSLRTKTDSSVELGIEDNLRIPIFLPDAYRLRHVHILGATGSGKTESVILNLIKQDTQRGIGSIILDAKGDASFIRHLHSWVPNDRLRVFDLGSPDSLTYNPLEVGAPLEAAQRLFSSLIWSEEYYKSKALLALQQLFQTHFNKFERNPTLVELFDYLDDPKTCAAITTSKTYSEKIAEKEYMDLAGLRDQVRTLTTGHLAKILSTENSQMALESASNGIVLYFRLQSLLSPQLVSTVGKLLVNHLNFLAGTAHRSGTANESKLVPTYLDEFASFACPEFADLISKARSANLALHFSHQSVGDLAEVSKGFLNRITDNSATKIVLRINDPDSAEFFSRSFGTKIYQKITQRITNVKEIDTAEVVGEGSQRAAHQFRAAPDLFKTLPTGTGSVLIAHGLETPHGASTVFKIKFPKI